MGQFQSKERSNEYFNLLITALVKSHSDESVVGAMRYYREKVQLQHGIILEYLSDVIVICSLVFMIALSGSIFESNVTFCGERKGCT